MRFEEVLNYLGCKNSVARIMVYGTPGPYPGGDLGAKSCRTFKKNLRGGAL